MSRLDAETRGWRMGVAMALADLNRMHDQPTMISDVLRDYCLTRAMLKTAGVDPHDINELSKCVRQGSAVEGW